MKQAIISPGYPTALKRFALIPIAVILVLVAFFQGLGVKASILPPLALPILNTLFMGIIFLTGAFYCARSFLANGAWQVLSMGSGMLSLSVAAPLAGWLLLAAGQNVNVTIYNTGVFTSAILFLCAAILMLKRKSPREESRRSLTLSVVYCAVAAFIALIAILSLQGRLPVFFIPDTGPTPIREVVLGTATALLIASAALLGLVYLESRMEFMYWGCLALGVISSGLIAAMFNNVFGDPMTWLSRFAQYLGSLYFLMSAVILTREARTKQIGISELISQFLSQSRANYELLVETSPDAIVSVDALGRVLTWNRAAETMFRYTRGEAIGLPLTGLLVPGSQADSFQKEMLGRTPPESSPQITISLELRAKRKDGTQFPCEVSLGAGRLPRGQFSTLIIRDITARKQAEEALRESEEKYRTIVETATEGIWTWDTDARTTFVNKRMAEMLGYSPAEMLGRPAFDFMDEEARQLAKSGLERRLQGKKDTYEQKYIRKDGSTLWAITSASPVLDSSGKTVAGMGLITDITARKQAEEALSMQTRLLSKIMENTRAKLVYLDRNFDFVMANKAYIEACGHSWEELKGKNHFAFFPNPENEAIFARCRDNGETVSFHDKPFMYAGQPWRGVTYWDWTLVPVKNSYGGVTGLVFSLIETTERVKAEESLSRAKDDLEVKVKDRTAELAEAEAEMRALSHRLASIQEEERRTIARELHDETGQYLTIIKMLVDNAVKSPDQAAAMCSEAARLVSEVIRQVRTMSLDLRPSMLDDLGLLPALVWLVDRFTTPTLHASLVHDHMDTTLTPDVNTAAYRIVQAALTNVVRHAEATEATVRLWSDDRSLFLTVEDNGRGFDMDSLDTGASTGISAMRERARLLGGKLEVTSTPGKGTTITAELPLYPEPL